MHKQPIYIYMPLYIYIGFIMFYYMELFLCFPYVNESKFYNYKHQFTFVTVGR